MSKSLHYISLSFLLFVAAIGTTMRLFYYVDLDIEFKHLLHAHSHIGFQGWIYTILFLLITKLFLSTEQIDKGRYLLQFKLTCILLVGILTSFLMQGYGFYSILFSTLFQGMNYWFIYRLFKDVTSKGSTQHKYSVHFLRVGLMLGILSTFAPIAIGIIASKGLAGSEIYRSAIYFFLHFQYNGWFLFILISLTIKWLENIQINLTPHLLKYFFICTATSVIPAYALSLIGMSFKNIIYPFAFFAAIVQLMGLYFFIKMLRAINFEIDLNKWTKILLQLGLFSFASKIILQFLSVFPYFSEIAFNNRTLIIFYMHFCLLGVLTLTIFSLLNAHQLFQRKTETSIGFSLFTIGFIGSEILLLIEGLFHVNLINWLIFFSLAMFLGVFFLLLNRKRS